jgi:hypothetical protein
LHRQRRYQESDALGDRLDPVTLDRGKAIKLHRGEEGDGIADLQIEWQFILALRVQDIGAGAGPASQDDGTARLAIARRVDTVMDAFAQRLVQAVVQPRIHIDPGACSCGDLRDEPCTYGPVPFLACLP